MSGPEPSSSLLFLPLCPPGLRLRTEPHLTPQPSGKSLTAATPGGFTRKQTSGTGSISQVSRTAGLHLPAAGKETHGGLQQLHSAD